ncbi:two-component system regulatory protein YycI [Paenibacillus hexagrammi]|uniref:Two-component system regulatory protein YycI n=1 Tax=Paenibacillus hexagrammi TaxID=2908839 RepID=A0ABY3SH66_9BACL|nr:two-component system regulatory protein YycI [Paenibacillus sp. YPD9-1]UJF33344.1 two-component system regulatory protein YycI [Paenibacillus sp. YPD9-1]
MKQPLNRSSIMGKGAGKELQARSGIPHFEAYELDSVTSKDRVYSFYQTYEELPLFDVRLQLYEDNGEITSYQQAYVEVESGVDQKEQKLISAQLAVRSLVENYLSEGSIITDVRLGYHGQLYNSQTQPMFPHWRVTIDNGDIYYLQAFNGAVEPPQRGSDFLPFGPQDFQPGNLNAKPTVNKEKSK